MEMVSTARFRKAYDLVSSVRPFTNRLQDMVGDMVERLGLENIQHELLAPAEGLQRDVLIAIASDRGLAGAYGSKVLDLAQTRLGQMVEAEYEVLLHVAGKQAIREAAQRGLDVAEGYEGFDHQSDYSRVRFIADALMKEFTAGRISGVEVAYTQFISSGRQQPVIAQILPVSMTPPPPRPPGEAEPPEYAFFPTRQDVLGMLLPATVRIRLYQCFVDAAVSEQLARMTAMRQATEAADEMIHDLTVDYNRMRQAQVTTELAEIMGGRVGID